ncbi:hypothetical protein C8Q78DRAFT_992038 [Trametes maxima]|nr:hypothetical protein C8Q78DRAFT_992038 [Trametes maxima]
MKITRNKHVNEAHALRIVEGIPGVHTPSLIDYDSGSDGAFILMTRIDGDCVTDVWDALMPSDECRMVAEIRTQLTHLKAHAVWLGLDFPRNANTLRPVVRPLIERLDGAPAVFCHGDILPKNLMLPGGFEKWRLGTAPLALIDREYAGWPPAPWEALKAT